MINDLIVTFIFEDKDFSINVISKSGTTTEPAIAFRLFMNLLVKNTEKADERIYITTDPKDGALRGIAISRTIQDLLFQRYWRKI